jgi:hypothetical protein
VRWTYYGWLMLCITMHYFCKLIELQILTLQYRTIGCFDEFAQLVLISMTHNIFFVYDLLIYCIEACIEIVLFSELLCVSKHFYVLKWFFPPPMYLVKWDVFLCRMHNTLSPIRRYVKFLPKMILISWGMWFVIHIMRYVICCTSMYNKSHLSVCPCICMLHQLGDFWIFDSLYFDNHS